MYFASLDGTGEFYFCSDLGRKKNSNTNIIENILTFHFSLLFFPSLNSPLSSGTMRQSDANI